MKQLLSSDIEYLVSHYNEYYESSLKMKDDIYDNDLKYLDTKFKDNDAYYFSRPNWETNHFIKLSLLTNNNYPVPDYIYNLTNREIIKKIQNKEIKLGLVKVHCIFDEEIGMFEETNIIISNHCISDDDIFANDWFGYHVG
jgi:hypothetical protein